MQYRTDETLLPGGERVPPTPAALRELHLALSRLATIRRAPAHAEIVASGGAVVVGCRVVIRHEDEEEESYVLVAPGEGDPRAGQASCDSPMGQALLHRRVGDVVEVTTPLGPRTLTVLHVDEYSPTDVGGAV